MSKTISIDTPDGNVTIDAKLFLEYNKRAQDLLEQISELGKDFKEEVEAVANNTNLKKSVISKYFKARFKASTKKSKEEGDLFEQLDIVLA